MAVKEAKVEKRFQEAAEEEEVEVEAAVEER